MTLYYAGVSRHVTHRKESTSITGAKKKSLHGQVRLDLQSSRELPHDFKSLSKVHRKVTLLR